MTGVLDVTGPAAARRISDFVAPSAFGASLGPAPTEVVALTSGSPAPEAFPAAELAEAFTAVLTDPIRAPRALDYSAHQGHAGLREFVAVLEGVDASRVVITNGALHALALPVLAALDPGDQVVVENPLYPLALKVLQLPGAVPVPIEVDADGLRVDLLADRLRGGFRPRAVYVVPDFHNPTGVTLSAERRRALVDLAERYGFLVVSDNPYPLINNYTGHPPVMTR